MKLINNISIPDIYTPDGKGYLKDNTFAYTERDTNVEFSVDTVNNAMILNCKKISAEFNSADFYYKEAPLIVAKGSLGVDLNTIRIQIGLGFQTRVLADGREVPFVTAEDVIVNIDRFDLRIHIHGSFFADLVDIIKPFIKGPLVDLINAQLYSALTTGYPAISNKFIAKTDGYFHTPLIQDWWLDWETPSAAIVTTDAFEIGIKGEMFDTRYGEENPAVSIPSMPNFTPSMPQGYQNYVSTWAMDAFFNSLLEVTKIGGWVKNPAITTSTLNAFLPGIEGYYGAGVPVYVNFKVQAVSNFTVTEANPEMGGISTLTLEFWA